MFLRDSKKMVAIKKKKKEKMNYFAHITDFLYLILVFRDLAHIIMLLWISKSLRKKICLPEMCSKYREQ